MSNKQLGYPSVDIQMLHLPVKYTNKLLSCFGKARLSNDLVSIIQSTKGHQRFLPHFIKVFPTPFFFKTPNIREIKTKILTRHGLYMY